MASTSETGHAKNAANLSRLILVAIGYGSAYNPSNEAIQIASLQATADKASEALQAVYAALANNSNAVAARSVAFKPLNKLTTRVRNALRATQKSRHADKYANFLVRKIQGARASAKLTEEEREALAKQGIEVNQISASQMTYNSRLYNFNNLINHLSSIALYVPNEAELSVAGLKAYSNRLQEVNQAVLVATVALSNARIARNKVLYAPNTGLVDTALNSKMYIRSVFGATSPQFKQVSKLQFINFDR